MLVLQIFYIEIFGLMYCIKYFQYESYYEKLKKTTVIHIFINWSIIERKKIVYGCGLMATTVKEEG